MRNDSNQTKERQYYLDWLRIFAIICVFIFHSFRFFDAENWHIKNDKVSLDITMYLSFLTALGMPLFFIISGMGTFYFLKFLEKRGINKKDYLSVRFIRLMVPFFIGLFTQIPIQVYLERKINGEFSGTFFAFYPDYFNGIYEFGGNFSIFGHHLWFLVILFVFSILTINFFTNLQKDSNININHWFLRNQRIIYSFPLIIFLSEFLWSSFTDFPLFGGWNFFSLLMIYILGFLLSYDSNLQDVIKKKIKSFMILNLTSLIGLIIVISAFSQDIFLPTPNEVFYSEPIYWFLRSIFSWSGFLIIIFLGKSFLNKDFWFRKSLNELVLPFYILHQTILVVIGFWIVQSNLEIIEKYFLITFLSLGLIMSLLLIIRMENTLRFVFGMSTSKDTSIWRLLKQSKFKDTNK